MPLSKSETRVVAALGQVMFPRGRSIAVDARDARLCDWVGAYLDAMPMMQRNQFKALIHSFNMSFGVAQMRPGSSFAAADPEAQREWIESWENSAIYQRRMAWDGLRTVLTMGYTESGAVRDALGISSGLETARRRMAELEAAHESDTKEAS